MNNKDKKLEKIKIILLVIIAVLLLLNLFQKSGIIENIHNTSKKLLNNGEMVLSEDGTVARTINSSNWDISKVTITKDADGKEVPVPKGYVGSSVTGENKISEGYVIYEGETAVTSSNVAVARTSRNQWVWVEVPDSSRIYEEVNGVKKGKLYSYGASGRAEYKNEKYEPAILPDFDTTTNLTNGGLSGMTPDKLYQELQQEFDSTIESIEKYGGFYIGRYETGNLSQATPVIRKMNLDMNNKNWFECYSKVKYLAVNSNVKTNLIWGCLWDETIQWLIERGQISYALLLDMGDEWGNFLNATFSYTSVNGGTNTKNKNSEVRISTGSSEYTKKNNIYDLAGNVWEWTLEGSGTLGRVFRGGDCAVSSEKIHPITRIGWHTPDWKYKNIGCRAYLYIK